jgi:hypothetical protein
LIGIKERVSRHADNARTDAICTQQNGKGGRRWRENFFSMCAGWSRPNRSSACSKTIDDFKSGDMLKLVIDCRPQPLYRLLDRNGFGTSRNRAPSRFTKSRSGAKTDALRAGASPPA